MVDTYETLIQINTLNLVITILMNNCNLYGF